ncbi:MULTISPECIES: DNA polymerase III subunit gamma/tau [unclassified Sphingobium]|uniref:DNA polymerase III subunit gamma/tau n=1 Tax=unclassified Sphingobium TaxID=2611147 RepID=UPI0022243DCA|nr:MULTISPECIES: DNA polymerase III subunit gamma/tau [unclassified Sphingobium]MCW2349744.1 DNA polymerase-3 subunit gamma/tau [Sphingobium sp. B12D2B]MCW2368862.1 DNA polymerase-3 subunit gamma/tau [Sphingobium sp. B11D3D]
MTDSSDDPGFDLGEPPRPQAAVAPITSPDAPAYRVLARAYRPQTFAELIGQEAMVRTLANAIKRERLPHAFLMTGVRGVGKTSTARLIAKALNCVGPDGQGGPTIDPCGVCEPCKAIAEGRHIDVIEMDAASHTGVDDVREIIEAVRYAAVSARFKIYIIDEVHMLSRNAFNALLKTLEEPPEHVKFLFATTEVNKVPITVLSRCQRFDLRRIPVELLVDNFRMICGKEGVVAEDDALRLIATAAEGSARDGQSILDQAIAHAGVGEDGRPFVQADQVREMLGLSDRGATRRLFDQILDGDAPAVLATLGEQEALGVEPLATVNALLDLIHAATTAKAGRGAGLDRMPEAERGAIAGWAEQLSFPVLHRLWQLLLKGHAEVAAAARPHAACEMALLRLIHASAMPDPAELARLIRDGAGGGQASPTMPAPAPSGTLSEAAQAVPSAPPPPAPPAASEPEAATPALPKDFAAMVEALKARHARLSAELHDYVSLVHYAPPELAFRILQPLDADFPRQVAAALREVTGEVWDVRSTDAHGQPSLREQEQAAKEARLAQISAAPIVAAALEAFPGARLVDPEDEQYRSEG